MPNQTEAALTRHWAVLIALISQISQLLGHAKWIERATRRRVLHLIRVAEALARRWLILNAKARGLTEPSRKSRDMSARSDTATGDRGATPSFCLLEPDPVLRPEDYSLEPFAPQATPTPVHAADPAPPMPVLALTPRLEALRDLAARPDHHTARMARWLRRAADKSRTAFVRLHPLRVGRPPGARRGAMSCAEQAALWWLDRLARDSLLPDWVP